MKKLLMSAAMLGCFAANAHAMDDAERARQMALFQNQVNGGAQITTTTTTAPVPMPTAPVAAIAAPVITPETPSHPLPAGAPTITASKNEVSRSLPPEAAETALTTTTTQQTMTTTTTAAAPAAAALDIPSAPVATATAAPTPVATGQMSPLNDDGTPMKIAADASSLGQTKTSSDKLASLSGGASAGYAKARHEREMQAWQQWQSASVAAPTVQKQETTTTVTTTASTPLVAPAAAPATTTTVTTTETAPVTPTAPAN